MQKSHSHALEIARETLRRLAEQRIVPTPENYREIYHAIAGTRPDEPFPTANLADIAAALPRQSETQKRLAQQFAQAIEQRDWSRLHAAIIEQAERHGLSGVSTATGRSVPAAATRLARVLREGLLPLVSDDAALADEIRGVADAAEAREGSYPHQSLPQRLDELITHLDRHNGEQRAIRQSLLQLLRLIVLNIRELVVDDNWLRGQIDVLSEVFERPLDQDLLDEAEQRLRCVIEKQSHLSRRMSEAQERLKNMLTGFVDRLAELSDNTGHYQNVLQETTEAIARAGDISELTLVVEKVLSETRTVQESAQRSGNELARLRDEVDSANHMIAHLQRELDETSERIRQDPLTGVLNRNGLDEALAREIDIARRLGGHLCLVVLDIDDFKQLNDNLGHRAGDEALQHMTGVMRESLRDEDLIGRLGGEEFLVVLPATDQFQGLQVIRRLQRELTRRFFLAGNQRILLTFSAGLAMVKNGEKIATAIDRADKAMYGAKRAGKNRVHVAN